MLYPTTELDDVKIELQSGTVYGYPVADDFNTALTYAAGVAFTEDILPIVPQADYTKISTTLYAALSTAQLYVYRAEVYFIIAEFLSMIERKEIASKKSYVESKSEGGVSRSGGGFSGKAAAATKFIQKANYCLSMAGYNIQQKIKVRASIHA
jgi:hypothetical protein